MPLKEKKKIYPFDPDCVYETRLERINLDEESERDLATGNGFLITEALGIKKSIKSLDGIFSPRFGQTLQDMNPFADRYKCECTDGSGLMGRIYNGIMCPKCKTRVRYIDDKFEYFGWIRLHQDYPCIHPNLYKAMEFFIGSDTFTNILKPVDDKNEDGHTIISEVPKDQPFYGIGIQEFKRRFFDVMEYYLSKSPQKKDYFDDIIENRDKIFTNALPVFTIHLRPFSIEDDSMYYNDINGIYNMVAKLAHMINKDGISIFRKAKPKKQLLYDLQCKYNELYDELDKLLSGKKGVVRQLFGGRYTFTSRNVIIPDPNLRIDQVILPYYALVELLQQTIINILCKTSHLTENEAHKIWYKASLEKNDKVWSIIEGIIKNNPSGEGIPILINRN